MKTVTCATWCTDGDGHPGYVLRADQNCWGEQHRVVLGLEEGAPALKGASSPGPSDAPAVSVFAHRRWHGLPTVRLNLYRESDNEHLSVDTDVDLTVDEALHLAKHLLTVVETIRGVSAMSDDTTVLVVDDKINGETFEVDCRPFEDRYPEYDGERILEIVHNRETEGSVVLTAVQSIRLSALLIDEVAAKYSNGSA